MISRTHNPVTSHIAAEKMIASGKQETHMILVLRYLRDLPGQTAGQYGELTGLGHIEAQRRLSDLKREGLVFQGEAKLWNGNKQGTWWLTQNQGQLL